MVQYRQRYLVRQQGEASGSVVMLAAALVSSIFFLCSANADETPIDHAQRQIDWIVANDAFYSPKLEFRRLSPDDPASSPSGLFASSDVSTGEVLITLPRKLFVTSDVDGTGEESEDICDTVRNLIKQYKLGEESEYWPYVNYVMDDRHKGDLPCDWSEDGKNLLESIIPDQLVPDLEATDISYAEICDVDEDFVGPLDRFAYLNVLRRRWVCGKKRIKLIWFIIKNSEIVVLVVQSFLIATI